MKLLLDSNTISYILRKRPPVISRLAAALEADAVFLSSEVVDYEIRRYLLLKGATRQLGRYESLSNDWVPVSLSRSDWLAAARLWAQLHRRGRSIEDRDLLIAVTTLKENATLVTHNVRHFQGLGVDLVDWSTKPRGQERG